MNHLSDLDNEELLARFEELTRNEEWDYQKTDEDHLKQLKQELLRRMTAAAETTPPAKPAYEEIVTGLERDIEHLARWSRS